MLIGEDHLMRWSAGIFGPPSEGVSLGATPSRTFTAHLPFMITIMIEPSFLVAGGTGRINQNMKDRLFVIVEQIYKKI